MELHRFILCTLFGSQQLTAQCLQPNGRLAPDGALAARGLEDGQDRSGTTVARSVTIPAGGRIEESSKRSAAAPAYAIEMAQPRPNAGPGTATAGSPTSPYGRVEQSAGSSVFAGYGKVEESSRGPKGKEHRRLSRIEMAKVFALPRYGKAN